MLGNNLNTGVAMPCTELDARGADRPGQGTGVEIDFPVSRQDIAEMTGTTLYTVSRLMSAWEERGILGGGRRRIVLLKAHALVTIAEDLPSS